MLDYNLYLGDRDETELYDWLCENIAPVLMTTKAEWDYFTMYHGDDDLWIMHSADVSDTSGSYDIITVLSFKNKEDALMAKLRFGGSMT
jgi:hypothetical protein